MLNIDGKLFQSVLVKQIVNSNITKKLILLKNFF